MQHFVITIGRQFGSGGREIANALAKRLDVPCYDKEMIELIASESGLSEKFVEGIEEKPTGGFFNSFAVSFPHVGNMIANFPTISLAEKVYILQSTKIKELAAKSSCVIVGRTADFILQEDTNVLNIFILSDLKYRINRIIEREKISEDAAEAMVVKNDKKRSSYYNNYTSKKWGYSTSYDMCLSSSRLGIDGVVEILYQAITKLYA